MAQGRVEFDRTGWDRRWWNKNGMKWNGPEQNKTEPSTAQHSTAQQSWEQHSTSQHSGTEQSGSQCSTAEQINALSDAKVEEVTCESMQICWIHGQASRLTSSMNGRHLQRQPQKHATRKEWSERQDGGREDDTDIMRTSVCLFEQSGEPCRNC